MRDDHPPRPDRRLTRWRAGIRQRRQHRAFRIAEPRWDDATRHQLRELADQFTLARTAAERVAKERSAARTSAGQGSGLPESELARAATNLWLAQKKFLRSGDPSSREFRQISRYLAATEEALDKAGVTIQDHDGKDFDAGFSLEVLGFMPDPELSREIVQRTVRPSIYLHRRLIQMGQVIVGRPVDPELDNLTEEQDAGHH